MPLNPYGNLGVSPATVRRITPSPVTKTPPRVPSNLGLTPTAQTPEEWAQALAEQYIQAQVDSINAQRQAYLDQLQQNSQLEAQRGQQLAQTLQGMNIPGQIQGIYGDLSANIGGLAQAFSGSLRDTATQDAANETRMVSGTGQEVAVANNGAALGDVLYGAQGYIPARSAGETGAAFASEAALEPGFAQRIGQVKAGDVMAQGMSGLTDFAQQIAQAQGQAPQLVQQLLNDRLSNLNTAQDNALQQAKYNKSLADAGYKKLNDDRNFYVKQAYLSLASGDRARSDQYLKLANEKETRMANAAKGYDAQGNILPAYTIGPDGLPVKRSDLQKQSKASQTAAAKAKTARTKGRAKREDEFSSARQDAFDEAKKLVVPATALRPEQRPPYQVAFQRLFDRYKDLLRFGTKGGQAKLRARLTQMIDEALAASGFVKPVKTPRTRLGKSVEPGMRDYPGA